MSPADPSAWGVFESYTDHRGLIHRPPAETVARVLAAMGPRDEGHPAPPVQVTTSDEPFRSDTAVAIEVEGGGRESLTDGRLPPELPFGYHRLVHADDSTSRVILSPGVCFLPPRVSVWGWAVQLYSARSRESWGIGDLRDVARLGRWARSVGAGAILVNPLSAVAPGIPQQASPYFPSSRCFLNPMYLRIEDLPGAAEAGEELTRFAERGRRLNTGSLIDRDAVYAVKMGALEVLWDRFEGAPGFEEYRAERGPLLRDFATHTAIVERYGSDRSSWPTGLARPDSVQTEQWRRAHHQRVRWHEWLQWHLDQQLQAASGETGLIHDLPVGVDPAGADAWMWQDVFADGIGVGAPPDELSAAGQGWGLAPFDPWKLQAAGYEPFIQTVRAALRH
ncbi:MAG: 4-alpha-glucanotransferase, partial [Actinomycetota bacterium]|nr:4-alpha-glucanotransferase [Actinomycetota bacterium]